MLAPHCAAGRPRRERRLQGNPPKPLSNLLIPGASGGKVIKTQKTLLGGGGRAIPTRLPSASSGGPTAQLSETPPGARAKIAKTPFLFERNALSGQLQPCRFLGDSTFKKRSVFRLNTDV